MRNLLPATATVVLTLTIAAGVAWSARSNEPAPPPAPGAIAVIELFTSQGCSSCPPADRLLTRLGSDPAWKGKVFPLAFHVDYWNRLGWEDPFSDAAWSARQVAYNDVLPGGTYTPQLVINGSAQCVGSQEAKVRNEIAAALARQPAGAVEVMTEVVGDRLTIRARGTTKRALEGPVELVVAVFENHLRTPVDRGENSDKVLEEGYVVRRLQTLAVVPAAAGATAEGKTAIRLDPRWKRENLGVLAFLQDPRTRTIHGAAVD